MNLLKATMIGGLIFLVPVVVMLLVLDKAVEIMLDFVEPLADLIPLNTVGGIATANVVALLTILIICLLAGLAARTAPVRRFAEKLENGILGKLPGYAMIKSLARSFDPSQQAELKPVLVNFGVRARVGLEVERVGEDRRAVYFPGAPNAWAGIVEIVSADLVEPLDVPVTEVLRHAELMGKHSAELLERS